MKSQMIFLNSYSEKINSGDIVVCDKIKKAIKRIEYLADKYTFDNKKSDYAIEFIERFCKHYQSKFAGDPLILELWQKVIIEATFGIVDNDGNRVIKELFIVIGRKNGKSTFISGLGLELLIAEMENGAEVYSVANKLDQAKIIYKSCYEMVKQSKHLAKHVRKTRTTLEFGSSVLKALSKDSNTMDGLNPYAILFDEVHATKDNSLYDVLKSAFGSRKNALMISLTSAGTIREGLFDYLYSLSERILEGFFIDDSFLPLIFELDGEDDWHDEKVWPKANPNLGISISVDTIRGDVKRADNDSKAKTELLTKRFNMPQATSNAFYQLKDIRNDETFDDDFIKGKYCLVGIDMSLTTDLTSVSFNVPIGVGKQTKFYLKQQYFLPKDNILEKEKQDKKPYTAWAESGLLTLIDGAAVDPFFISKYIKDEVERLKLTVYKVCVDRWKIDMVERELSNYGLNVEQIAQGYQTLSPVTYETEVLLKEKRLIHNNNPITVWNFANVGVKRDENNNVRPIKGNGSANKIDGVMSYMNTLSVYMQPDARSFFEVYQGGED